jgi:hypothetical protein
MDSQTGNVSVKLYHRFFFVLLHYNSVLVIGVTYMLLAYITLHFGTKCKKPYFLLYIDDDVTSMAT